MYPYILFFGENVPSYIVCSGVGLIVSYGIFSLYVFRKDRCKQYMRIILLSLISLILFARIFGILSQIIDMLCRGEKIDIKQGISNSGIVYYGGVLGFVCSCSVLCKIRKYNFVEIRNILAIVIPCFHFFGRIGCYFAGCCYGIVCNNFLGIPYRISVENKYELRIPLQLYEAGFECILFVLILILNKKNAERNFLKMYFLLYAIWRLLIEELRGDDIRGVFWGISFSQAISIIIIFILSCSYIKNIIKNRRRKKCLQ